VDFGPVEFLEETQEASQELLALCMLTLVQELHCVVVEFLGVFDQESQEALI